MSILGGPPNPVIVTIRDNRDYIKILLDSYYTTITGWGGPPKVYFFRTFRAQIRVSLCGPFLWWGSYVEDSSYCRGIYGNVNVETCPKQGSWLRGGFEHIL